MLGWWGAFQHKCRHHEPPLDRRVAQRRDGWRRDAGGKACHTVLKDEADDKERDDAA